VFPPTHYHTQPPTPPPASNERPKAATTDGASSSGCSLTGLNSRVPTVRFILLQHIEELALPRNPQRTEGPGIHRPARAVFRQTRAGETRGDLTSRVQTRARRTSPNSPACRTHPGLRLRSDKYVLDAPRPAGLISERAD